MFGVQKATGASLGGFPFKAVTIAGRIDAALMVDVGSLEGGINCRLKCVNSISYKRTEPIGLAWQ
jgi:hypothetical protein